MPYAIEHTDTFSGEANYCWVRRYVFKGTERQAVRAALAAAGWTGRGARRTYVGNFTAEYRIPRLCQVVFVFWCDENSTEANEWQAIGTDGHPVENGG